MNFLKSFLLIVFALSLSRLSFAEKEFFFEGQIDFTKNEFSIVLDLDEKSSVTAKAQKTSETDYRFLLDIEHLKTPLYQLNQNSQLRRKTAPYTTLFSIFNCP